MTYGLGRVAAMKLVIGLLIALVLSDEATPANAATRICPVISCLSAHDIGGIQLDMGLAEVTQLFSGKLQSLGSGQYQGRKDGINYDLGFSSRGHLFRINSSQELGRFEPDAGIAAALTKRLAEKYGPPQENQLPGGTATWEFMKTYEANGSAFNLFTETLHAHFMEHYQAPTTLELQLMDRRIERRDDALKNADPSAMARAQMHF